MGVLVLLAYLMADAAVHLQSVWRVPNLLASALHDDSRIRTAFSFRTVSGLALAIVIYGTLGALAALLTPVRLSRGYALVIALLAASGWYAFSASSSGEPSARAAPCGSRICFMEECCVYACPAVSAAGDSRSAFKAAGSSL